MTVTITQPTVNQRYGPGMNVVAHSDHTPVSDLVKWRAAILVGSTHICEGINFVAAGAAAVTMQLGSYQNYTGAFNPPDSGLLDGAACTLQVSVFSSIGAPIEFPGPTQALQWDAVTGLWLLVAGGSSNSILKQILASVRVTFTQ